VIEQGKAYLVKVEHQIQLTYVAEELIQHLYKEVYSLQICQAIVIGVHTCAEEESRVAAIDYLATTAKLDEVGLVFLIARGDEAVDFTLEFDLLVVGVGVIPFGESSLASGGVLVRSGAYRKGLERTGGFG
jgi:hypothetical protein